MDQNTGRTTFFTLPFELRIIIYKLVLEDDLDLPIYTTKNNETNINHIIPLQYLNQQMVNLRMLALISDQVKEEAVEQFHRLTQLYVRHEKFNGLWWPAWWPADPLLKEASHVRWTVMLASDEGVFRPYHHDDIDVVRIRFSPDAMRPWRGGITTWLGELKNLKTLHLDVNWRRDWLDLCAESAWLYPIYLQVKKLVLSLNFEGATKYINRAWKSRYVQRGKPREMLEHNILNHLLTLPQDEFKDAPDLPIRNHFGAINPEWPRESRT
ncbi:hypothetical protein QBC32DRAFT_311063 [Pseudoneurospora amorphoporcata]|uniref:Uncharacterized protein n=1 Tax=Pseudoneurospora amorphoporcata TaxID=241081 RepID=A0AAN6SJ07_9PEZI|nr:hypothetical protein QBC32DRAFT_311063 [Pseudoneurospora amorphoporcata]